MSLIHILFPHNNGIVGAIIKCVVCFMLSLSTDSMNGGYTCNSGFEHRVEHLGIGIIQVMEIRCVNLAEANSF